jgi:hypothetical protein
MVRLLVVVGAAVVAAAVVLRVQAGRRHGRGEGRPAVVGERIEALPRFPPLRGVPGQPGRGGPPVREPVVHRRRVVVRRRRGRGVLRGGRRRRGVVEPRVLRVEPRRRVVQLARQAHEVPRVPLALVRQPVGRGRRRRRRVGRKHGK